MNSSELSAPADTSWPQRLTGLLLAFAMLGMALHALLPDLPPLLPALGFWLAGLLVWPKLPLAAQRQSLALIGTGLLAIAWAWSQGRMPDWYKALTANAALLAMLTAVSFLSLVSTPRSTDAALPQGRPALASTLLGIHLFGAVINLSALFIMADRLTQQPMGAPHALERRQAIVLTRGFAAAAFWSPFFAAMAVALTFAPGARLEQLMLSGAPLAILALWLTWRELRAEQNPPFTGYPMRYHSLWLPLLLALAVLLSRTLWPQLSVLGLIALLAPLLTLSILLLRPAPAGPALQNHIDQRLPRMANELVLFLSAGIMAAGLSVLFSLYNDWLPFDSFGATEASLLLLALLALSLIGIHPVISITTCSSLLQPLTPDPNLLGMLFLALWATGAACGPLSGMNLAIHGRYYVPGRRIMRWNLTYGLKMTLAASVMMHLYQWL